MSIWSLERCLYDLCLAFGPKVAEQYMLEHLRTQIEEISNDTDEVDLKLVAAPEGK